jgi:putative FmdB family regulatory protein
MPTYQYACTSCGERLEAVQKFTDDPLTICPSCNGALRKVFSPVGVVFKGSGFYKTDSRSSGSTSSASPAAGTSATGSGSGETGKAGSESGSPTTTSSGSTGAASTSTSSGSSTGSGSTAA